MFVRRKQNKTGTTSIQVIDKSHGSYRVIKSFGVGHSEVEIDRLEEKARQYILEFQGLANGLFEDEDDLRKTGYSKDGKNQCPQIFLRLLGSKATHSFLSLNAWKTATS